MSWQRIRVDPNTPLSTLRAMAEMYMATQDLGPDVDPWEAAVARYHHNEALRTMLLPPIDVTQFGPEIDVSTLGPILDPWGALEAHAKEESENGKRRHTGRTSRR
jgi:hypothetical protein